MNTFQDLIPRVLKREGGYVNNPDDRGGATNYGITQSVYRKWKKNPGANVKNLTKTEAGQIYYKLYWEPSKAEQLPAEIRDVHFDAAVNHGVSRANKLLQGAAGAVQDGIIGNRTIAAVNEMDARLLVCRYVAARYKLYTAIVQRDRSQAVFMAGWMNRMKEFNV